MPWNPSTWARGMAESPKERPFWYKFKPCITIQPIGPIQWPMIPIDSMVTQRVSNPIRFYHFSPVPAIVWDNIWVCWNPKSYWDCWRNGIISRYHRERDWKRSRLTPSVHGTRVSQRRFVCARVEKIEGIRNDEEYKIKRPCTCTARIEWNPSIE